MGNLWLGFILLGAIVAFYIFFNSLEDPGLKSGTYRGFHPEGDNSTIVVFFIRSDKTFDYLVQEFDEANQTYFESYNTTLDAEFVGRFSKVEDNRYLFILERDSKSGAQEELIGKYDNDKKELDFGQVDGGKLVLRHIGSVDLAFQ